MILNKNHLLMANISKLHECRTFGLIKMHNTCKIWFANNIFSLWESLVYDKRAVTNGIFKFLPLPFTQISNDYIQKSYNGFWGFLVISATSQIFLIYTFLTMKRRPCYFFLKFARICILLLYFSKWKKHYNLLFNDVSLDMLFCFHRFLI